jgi:2-polyprenyl-3-methyl-5-hydroxy-6-metoxy-1,4-benzoquinol methylase
MSAPKDDPANAAADHLKVEEIVQIVRGIQERVRGRYPGGAAQGGVVLPDLMPLVEARDAAEAKVAAIGTVNPRPPGFINSLAQGFKRIIARALDWHVREQVEFNRAAMSCVQTILEALTDVNRAIAEIAATREQLGEQAREFADIRRHWAEWRAGWEEKTNRSEVYLLRTISELNSAFQHRLTSTENDFRQAMRDQHANFENALQLASHQIQERLWADLARIRGEYEKLIHDELRVVRQRAAAAAVSSQADAGAAPRLEAGAAVDWLRFAQRFRGSEERVRRAQEFYRERFAGLSDILDIGCGRGEFLEVARDAGIAARGIDANPENVGLCRAKGLDAEVADMFDHLRRQPDESLGGVFCAQVIEHLAPPLVAELIRQLGAKVRRGGLAAFETPNPECLAIFAAHFYLDPTHTRPVPAALLAFYLEEAGFGNIEVRYLAPASESFPALAEIPERFRESFFGGLDYAVFARKL